MDKITTITTLINLYYSVCDNYEDYMPKDITGTEISICRENIVNTIYILIYNKMKALKLIAIMSFAGIMMFSCSKSGKKAPKNEQYHF